MLKINSKTTKIIALATASLLFHGCAAVVVGSAATSAVVAQDRRTTGTIVEDKSIQLKAAQAIQVVTQDDPLVHVYATSYNNRVLLAGQVPSSKMRGEIESAVRKIKKIQHLHNEITVDEPTSTFTRSNDSWITAKIKSVMTVTRDINPTRVKVVTENGIVYLMGIVTPLEEDVAVDIARHTKGVTKVVKIFEYEGRSPE